MATFRAVCFCGNTMPMLSSTPIPVRPADVRIQAPRLPLAARRRANDCPSACRRRPRRRRVPRAATSVPAGLGPSHPRHARGRRTVRLIDEIEERPQLVHVAEPACASRPARSPGRSGRRGADDPFAASSDRGSDAPSLLGRRTCGRRRHLGRRTRRRRGGLLARHDERVTAGRALHGRAALGDAVVIELVFGLATIAANVHDEKSVENIPWCARPGSGGGSPQTSQTLGKQRVELGRRWRVGPPHHEVSQVIHEEAAIERPPEHERRGGRGCVRARRCSPPSGCVRTRRPRSRALNRAGRAASGRERAPARDRRGSPRWPPCPPPLRERSRRPSTRKQRRSRRRSAPVRDRS